VGDTEAVGAVEPSLASWEEPVDSVTRIEALAHFKSFMQVSVSASSCMHACQTKTSARACPGGQGRHMRDGSFIQFKLRGAFGCAPSKQPPALRSTLSV
jgi:hypothetical protein